MSSSSTSVSIIISVKNNGIDLYTTMESLKVSQTTLPYEVIIVDEGSIDGCCDFLMNYRFDQPFQRIKGEPGTSARNLGAAHARGDYLIFSGSHLYYDDGWMERLLEPLMQGQADAVSPAFEKSERSTVPAIKEVGGMIGLLRRYPIQRADQNLDIPWLSWECFAVGRSTFREMEGLVDGFFGKDVETAEFSLRLWLQGRTCQIVPDVTLMQVFRQNFPYDNSREMWGVDLLTLANLHFGDELTSVCREQVNQAFGEELLEAAQLSPLALARKEKFASLRKHDAAWLFERFGVHWKS